MKDAEQKLRGLAAEAMISERAWAERELRRIRRRRSASPAAAPDVRRLEALERRLRRSVRHRRRRARNRPRPVLEPDLPIAARRDDIVAAVGRSRVVVVSGETGSGKTTQLPRYCLEAGRGIGGRIACTQPRRVAAVTVAARIAEEFGQSVGRDVGYKIRFEDRSRPDGYIQLMTDGILLAEAQGDRLLSAYDTVIVDEAHERSLNIDFLLGLLQKLLRRRRDLRMLVTSATIDTEKFARALGGAPVIEVSGRRYPVEVRYMPPEDEPDAADGEIGHVEMAVRAVRRLQAPSGGGDILVFMPTEQDIRETCELLAAGPHHALTVLPLYGRLSAAEQARVFRTGGAPRVVVATNVAETSVTIPGIRCVVDTGLARIAHFSPQTRTTSLPVTTVSRASADQRAGRCGRLSGGVCIRLYSLSDYEDRPRFTAPEILRTNLAEVILRMMALDIGKVETFPFIDPPAPRSIRDGYGLLEELGAIRPGKGRNGRRRLTAAGRQMARLPVDPRLARMLLEAERRGCLDEVTIIAAALSIQDPRERPLEHAREADAAREPFLDPRSDFTTLLNLWRAFAPRRGAGSIKKFCRQYYLSFRRMREWRQIHRQLTEIMSEWKPPATGRRAPSPRRGRFRPPGRESSAATAFDERYAAVHRSILAGFLSNIAERREKNLFAAARGRVAMIFPGSGLFNRAGAWIVAAEMVKTSRLFARTAAAIDPAWVEPLAGDLCRRSHRNPRWDPGRGEVVADEQVTLYGLTIVARRTVSYGPHNPEEATEVFVRSALVDGRLGAEPGFLAHNRGLVAQVRDMEHRLRRSDLLVSPEQQAAFYLQRLETVFSRAGLKKRIGRRGDGFLHMRLEDLLNFAPGNERLALFPDTIGLGPLELACRYRYDPGRESDGMTIRVPAAQAAAVPEASLDWLAPGLREEKVAALLRGLPKVYRRRLVPIGDTAAAAVREMPVEVERLTTALGRYLKRRFALDIPPEAWSAGGLPEHLTVRLEVTAPDGTVLRAGRGAEVLRRRAVAPPLPAEAVELRRQWERYGLLDWDIGSLPERLSLRVGRETWAFYPTLSAADTGADLRLLTDRAAARRRHPRGVAALLARRLKKDLGHLRRRLVLPADVRRAAAGFGGAPQVLADLENRVRRDLLERDVRGRAQFESAAAEAAAAMTGAADRLLAAATSLLRVAGRTRGELAELAAANRFSGPAQAALAALEQDLHRLVPGNFLELYELERFAHLERYLRAMAIRARRVVLDPEKDRTKAERVTRFEAELQSLLNGLTAESTAEHRRTVEDFFWRLEEFKVSVFAQELGTDGPVSAKRLEKRLAEIRRGA